MRYTGPLIDAHTHLWDLRVGSYPWLAPTGNFGGGRFNAMKGRNYLLEDYRADVGDNSIVASVHVEALWDADDDPANETLWLESLEDRDKLIDRYVGATRLSSPQAPSYIARQAAFPRMRGIRQTIAWTPDPNVRMVDEPHLALDPRWTPALEALVEHDLALELLMYPWQAEDIIQLTADNPELRIIINHIGSPIDQTPEGLERWRTAITRMAGASPHVLIKLSAAGAYVEHATAAAIRPFVEHVVKEFGPERVMWASDFPVGKMTGLSFTEYLDLYRDCLQDQPQTVQEAIFFSTAARVYGFETAALRGSEPITG